MTYVGKVRVAQLPPCDACIAEGVRPVEPATYDAKTAIDSPGLGQWGFLCRSHFKRYGIGLGTGKGQELVVE